MNGAHTLAKKMYTGLTPKKDNVRRCTINEIMDFVISNNITHQRFLTLSSAFWQFEKDMAFKLRTFGFSKYNFTSCERDYKLFKVAATRIMKTNKPLSVKWIPGIECEMVTNGSTSKIFNTDVFKLLAEPTKNRLAKNPNAIIKPYNIVWLDTMTPVSYLLDKLPIVLKEISIEPSMIIITVLKGREHKPIEGTRTDVISKCFPTYNLIKSWEYMDSCPMLQLVYSNVEASNSIVTE